MIIVDLSEEQIDAAIFIREDAIADCTMLLRRAPLARVQRLARTLRAMYPERPRAQVFHWPKGRRFRTPPED